MVVGLPRYVLLLGDVMKNTDTAFGVDPDLSQAHAQMKVVLQRIYLNN